MIFTIPAADLRLTNSLPAIASESLAFAKSFAKIVYLLGCIAFALGRLAGNRINQLVIDCQESPVSPVLAFAGSEPIGLLTASKPRVLVTPNVVNESRVLITPCYSELPTKSIKEVPTTEAKPTTKPIAKPSATRKSLKACIEFVQTWEFVELSQLRLLFDKFADRAIAQGKLTVNNGIVSLA